MRREDGGAKPLTTIPGIGQLNGSEGVSRATRDYAVHILPGKARDIAPVGTLKRCKTRDGQRPEETPVIAGSCNFLPYSSFSFTSNTDIQHILPGCGAPRPLQALLCWTPACCRFKSDVGPRWPRPDTMMVRRMETHIGTSREANRLFLTSLYTHAPTLIQLSPKKINTDYPLRPRAALGCNYRPASIVSFEGSSISLLNPALEYSLTSP